MKTLRSPLVVVLLGVVPGLLAGLGLFWIKIQPILIEARAIRAAWLAEQAASLAKPRPEKPWDFWTIEIDNLSSELKDARALLTKREQELTLREERLNARAAELDQARVELEALRDEIGSRLTEIEGEEMKNLKSLAQTYSNLSPKAAVAIMQKLDDDMTARLLSLMKADATGAIFEEMAQAAITDPNMAKRAAGLSERLRVIKSARKIATP
ncbi:hypothetical protein Ga0100231_006350 [Opitutaceae bacterium TAV4]|nr:hypothetical protein Ga0100231_006350 [Opitutaceae bacterium TAV4]RRK02565.1 hypothetical protein Ga0100230_005480 [Opitutaceae bacterium TAV3]RRK02618.1 hypothetical protein Ga0100230_005760 [Opitutaceae bacterium TAV3]